jgi:hypothetical protein
MTILHITIPVIVIAAIYSIIQHVRIRHLQARYDAIK